MSDHETGYGRPPKAHQFRKGQSGNPKGRTRGAKNLQTAVQSYANEKISLTRAGRTITLSRKEALVQLLGKRAFEGDTRAMERIMQMIQSAETTVEERAQFKPQIYSKERENALQERLRIMAQTLNREDPDDAGS